MGLILELTDCVYDCFSKSTTWGRPTNERL